MQRQDITTRLARAVTTLSLVAALVTTLTMTTACEKPIIDENGVVGGAAADANVILRFTQYEQDSFTRAATDVTELCSRLNIAIFDADGTKVKTVAQKEGDAGYGTAATRNDCQQQINIIHLYYYDTQH